MLGKIKFGIAIGLFGLLLLIGFQNLNEIRVNVLFYSFRLPQIVLIMITSLLGAIGGFLISRWLSHRSKAKNK